MVGCCYQRTVPTDGAQMEYVYIPGILLEELQHTHIMHAARDQERGGGEGGGRRGGRGEGGGWREEGGGRRVEGAYLCQAFTVHRHSMSEEVIKGRGP